MWLSSAVLFLALAVSQLLATHTYGIIKDMKKDSRFISLEALEAHIEDSRLPRQVAPTGYRLELQAFPEDGHFMGRVRINLTCREPTDVIFLHSHTDLNIRPPGRVTLTKLPFYKAGNPTVNERVASSVKVEGVKHDPIKQWLMVKVVEKLKKGRFYQMEILFDGNLNSDKDEGFFRGSYEDHKTKERRWFAATHMKPTNARRVFPCFDEPAYKVPLELSVARPIKSRVVSNMPIKGTETISSEGEWVWDHFMRTPPLASFSIGLLISDLGHLEPFNISNNVNNNNVTVTVFGRSHFLGHLEYVADMAREALASLQDEFGIPFPLPELNIVALPHFASSTPSNSWGLVLFQEKLLTGKSAQWFLVNQLVEQWLGHMVTPHWWSDARLNQALANFIATAHAIKADCHDSWGVSVGYKVYYKLSQHNEPGQDLDAVRTTKTEWLLRMLSRSLTENTFKAGLQEFMREREYDTYFEDDVWGSLTKQAWEDKTLEDTNRVEDIARSWVYQDRFPVVTVHWDWESGNMNISQHTFVRGAKDTPANEKLLWWIPITYLTMNAGGLVSSRPITWLRAEREVTDIYSTDEEMIVNPDETGMFLVNYSPAHWERLSGLMVADRTDGAKAFSLDFQDTPGKIYQLPIEVRAKLLHDSWNLALAGELDFGAALNMTRYLAQDTAYPVWHVMLNMADQLLGQIDGTLAAGKFKDYFLRQMAAMYESLPEEASNEDWDLALLREKVWVKLCGLAYGPCLEEAKTVYKEWVNSTNPEEGTAFISDLHLCTVFQWGSFKDWMFALQMGVDPPVPSDLLDRPYLLMRLADCLRDRDAITSLLTDTFFVASNDIPNSDLRIFTERLADHAVGRSTLLRFLGNNWHTLKIRFETDPAMWDFYVESAMLQVNTQKSLNAVEAVLAERTGQFGDVEGRVRAALNATRIQIEWSNVALPQINAWLDSRLARTAMQY